MPPVIPACTAYWIPPACSADGKFQILGDWGFRGKSRPSPRKSDGCEGIEYRSNDPTAEVPSLLVLERNSMQSVSELEEQTGKMTLY
jgi:hypothetical protein